MSEARLIELVQHPLRHVGRLEARPARHERHHDRLRQLGEAEVGAAHVAPPFIAKADGAYMEDVDGHRYVDYIGSWGPMVLGQTYQSVIEAVQKAATRGTSFGAPTEIEIELAEKLVELVPSLEMVRMVNPGTEAVMSALRVARGFTGRDLVVKFEGLDQSGNGRLCFGSKVAELINGLLTGCRVLSLNGRDEYLDFVLRRADSAQQNQTRTSNDKTLNTHFKPQIWCRTVV